MSQGACPLTAKPQERWGRISRTHDLPGAYRLKACPNEFPKHRNEPVVSAKKDARRAGGLTRYAERDR